MPTAPFWCTAVGACAPLCALCVCCPRAPAFSCLCVLLSAHALTLLCARCVHAPTAGRMFPVDIMYTKAPEADYLDAVVVTVLQVIAYCTRQ